MQCRRWHYTSATMQKNYGFVLVYFSLWENGINRPILIYFLMNMNTSLVFCRKVNRFSLRPDLLFHIPFYYSVYPAIGKIEHRTGHGIQFAGSNCDSMNLFLRIHHTGITVRALFPWYLVSVLIFSLKLQSMDLTDDDMTRSLGTLHV